MLADLVQAMKAAHKVRDQHAVYTNNMAAWNRRVYRLRETQDRRRALVQDIGGKAVLQMLRESARQDSRCADVDEMEAEIEILRKELATLTKACDEYEETICIS
jgi:hypothetical protein